MGEEEQKNNWRRFKKLKLNPKHLSRRAKRAEVVTTRHAHKFVLRRLASIRAARRQIINWLALVAVLIVAIALQMAWTHDSYETKAQVAGGTYAEGMLGPIQTLNPLYARSNAELAASKLIFSGLLDYDTTGKLRNDVALSITADSAGKVYTAHLRDDVRWHDGTLLTADDVVFTTAMMRHPDTRATLASSWEQVKVRALDPRTVQFTLPSSYGAFPHALTFPILPKHLLGEVDPGAMMQHSFGISPVGSGPFSLRLLQTVGSSEEKIVHLSGWESYHRGAPSLARFELHGYAQPADIVKAINEHDINAALDLPSGATILPDDFTMTTHPLANGVYALLNTRSPVLKDKQIRRALQLGTDVEKVRQVVGDAPQLDSPVLPSQLLGVTLPQKPALNAAAAQQLLQKAGWKLAGETRTKRGQPLRIELAAVKDARYSAVMNELARQWRELGFEVVQKEFDGRETGQSFAQAVLQPRAYDVLIHELAIGADPDVFAYWHSSQAGALGRNFSSYKSQVADDILVSARLSSDETLRAQKYRAFTRQWLADAPAIGLYQSVMEYAKTARVSSFTGGTTLPSPTERYANVLYWTAEQGNVYKTP